MNARSYQQVLREAESLAPEDQLQLIAHLAESLRDVRGGHERWEDYAGSAPYPLCDEDAQAWVTRTRQQSDDFRRPL